MLNFLKKKKSFILSLLIICLVFILCACSVANTTIKSTYTNDTNSAKPGNSTNSTKSTTTEISSLTETTQNESITSTQNSTNNPTNSAEPTTTSTAATTITTDSNKNTSTSTTSTKSTTSKPTSTSSTTSTSASSSSASSTAPEFSIKNYEWLEKKYSTFTGALSTDMPEKTIIYKQCGNIKLPMNIYYPVDGLKEHNITVICIEGSGWNPTNITTTTWEGSKYMKHTAQYFANCGFVAIEVNYRSLSNTANGVYDCIEDCQDAYQYIVHNLDFVDDDKIILLGESAGGNLVLNLVLNQNRNVSPFTVVAINPVVNLNSTFYGGKAWTNTAATQELRSKASPSDIVRKIDSKLLLVHGTADTVTSYNETVSFMNNMIAKGNSCELISINGANHACLLYGYHSTTDFINQQMARVYSSIKETIYTFYK